MEKNYQSAILLYHHSNIQCGPILNCHVWVFSCFLVEVVVLSERQNLQPREARLAQVFGLSNALHVLTVWEAAA